MCEINVLPYLRYRYVNQSLLCLSSNGRKIGDSMLPMLPTGTYSDYQNLLDSLRGESEKTNIICDRELKVKGYEQSQWKPL